MSLAGHQVAGNSDKACHWNHQKIETCPSFQNITYENLHCTSSFDVTEEHIFLIDVCKMVKLIEI